jgi:RNA polymerase sigma-70 factor, ECF subfamily
MIPGICVAFRTVAAEDLQQMADPQLALALQEQLSAARAAWPTLAISDEDFVAFLAERSGPSGLPPLAHAADLLLACACIAGDRGALSAFHAHYDRVVTRVLQRRAGNFGAIDDVRQAVFEKLLVAADGERPKLGDYRGTGSLKSWVASVAMTTLLMTRRSQLRRREQPTDDQDPIVDHVLQSGPELHYLKVRYRGPVEAAIVSALGQLADRERVLLRLHLCERMSIDRLGEMYGVNRATAARWLVNARQALLRATRLEIRRGLGVSDGECDSILNLVHSQLDVSLARHLGG